MELTIIVGLFIFGSCFGSFAAASVWRLRARQLEDEKNKGDEYDRLKKIITATSKDRSKCLDCGYRLRWYDMVPVFSWLFLKGKCRKCKKSIGSMEIASEILVGLFFVLSYVLWPVEITNLWGVTRFILWLMAGVIFSIMVFYDKKWFLLPRVTTVFLFIIGMLNSIITIIISSDKFSLLIYIIASIFIMSGIYFILHIVSKGKWIGFGDVELGLGLALFLVDWRLAFIALFLANFLGCLIVLPGLISKKLTRKSRIPFGPFLIFGTVITVLFGDIILSNVFFYLS